MLLSKILLSVLLLFVLRFFVQKLIEFRNLKKRLRNFVGPKAHPLIGNLDLGVGSQSDLFYMIRILGQEFLKRKVGVVIAWMAHIPLFFVIHPAEVELIISGVANTKKATLLYKMLEPWLGTGLLTSHGTKWQHRRKILTPAFHFNILPKFVEVFNRKCRFLVRILNSNTNKDVNIVPYIAEHTFNSIAETSMGATGEQLGNSTLSNYYKSLVDLGETLCERVMSGWMLLDIIYILTPSYWRQNKIIKRLHKVSRDMISIRKVTFELEYESKNYSNNKKITMLDILLKEQKENGNIDDEGIREEVDTFTFEGQDTTALCLIYTVMLLANNRNHQDRIYEEIIAVLGDNDDDPTIYQLQELTYMEMCIKESLRLYPSVPLIGRTTDQDVTTSKGNVIPANTNIIIDIFTLHRNEDIYPDPETFNPDRFLPDNIAERSPFAFLPFSAGPRNCIGQKFAMLEVKCTIIHLLKSFILEPIETPESIRFLLDIVLRPTGPIRVKFVPRK